MSACPEGAGVRGFVCAVRTCANWQHPPLQHGVEVHAGQNARGTGSAGGCRLQSSQPFAHPPHEAHLGCAVPSGAALRGRFELAAVQSHGECRHCRQLAGGAVAAFFFRLQSLQLFANDSHNTHRFFFPDMRVRRHLSAAPVSAPFHTENVFDSRGRSLWGRVFPMLGVPTVARNSTSY
jgi:hypothetical protein